MQIVRFAVKRMVVRIPSKASIPELSNSRFSPLEWGFEPALRGLTKALAFLSDINNVTIAMVNAEAKKHGRQWYWLIVHS